MISKTRDNILEDEDAQIIRKALSHGDLNDKETDVLNICENLGYDVNKELIEELMLVEGFGLDEYYNQVTIRFYTYPDEKDSRPSFALRRRIKSLGNDFVLISLAYRLRNKEKVKQDTEGLTLKRVKLPMYLAIIVKNTGFINCKSDEEILSYNMEELIDTFK